MEEPKRPRRIRFGFPESITVTNKMSQCTGLQEYNEAENLDNREGRKEQMLFYTRTYNVLNGVGELKLKLVGSCKIIKQTNQ